MKYGNKKKKMGAGGVSGSRKKMRAGGPTGNPIRGGSDYMPKPPRLIGRPLNPRKRPINPKVPMKKDAEGRKGMQGGGVPQTRLGKVARRPMPKQVPGGGGMVPGQLPPDVIGRAVPPKRPIGPKVPMKMDSEGRRGMKHGGTTGSAPGVVSYQDYVKKTFG